MVIKKWKNLLAFLAIWIAAFSLGTTVLADDDDQEHDDEEKYEHYQKSDDGQWESNQQSQFNTVQQTEYWNMWSREPRNNPGNPLPITEPAELTAMAGNQETSVYFIPQEDQLLVSGDATAAFSW